MKLEQFKEYIESFLDDHNADYSEINNALLLLYVYMCGLEKKDFPLDKLNSISPKDIPEEYHATVSKIAIKKSGIGGDVGDYLTKVIDDSLIRFKNYIIK